MIANEETDDKWIVGMVDYNKNGMVMKQRWQASVLTVSWVITHEEIGNKRMNVKDGWWSLTKKMTIAG
jgi:hypothetical protein